jgi:hypothetical protein
MNFKYISWSTIEESTGVDSIMLNPLRSASSIVTITTLLVEPTVELLEELADRTCEITVLARCSGAGRMSMVFKLSFYSVRDKDLEAPFLRLFERLEPILTGTRAIAPALADKRRQP